MSSGKLLAHGSSNNLQATGCPGSVTIGAVGWAIAAYVGPKA